MTNRIKSLELALKMFCNPFDPCPGGEDRLPWNERTFDNLLEVAEVLNNYLDKPSRKELMSESIEEMLGSSLCDIKTVPVPFTGFPQTLDPSKMARTPPPITNR